MFISLVKQPMSRMVSDSVRRMKLNKPGAYLSVCPGIRHNDHFVVLGYPIFLSVLCICIFCISYRPLARTYEHFVVITAHYK